ncbi:MAG: response regulator transcription factor [Acidobacteriota bacterium]
MHERILVVDDEPQITRVLRAALSSQRYDVRTANDPEEALRLFAEWKPDLLITDLAMPDINGVDICRKVRKANKTPIIVLSVRDQEHSKVEALDAGADDYVTKPFSTQELLARVRAQLRRAPERSAGGLLEIGDFQIDIDGHMVRVAGSLVHLTPKEFELIVFFSRNAGKVLTHHALLGGVWGAEAVQQPEYLRVFVGQLRKKLSGATGKDYIQTEPWIGYRFNPEGATE